MVSKKTKSSFNPWRATFNRGLLLKVEALKVSTEKGKSRG